MSGGIGGGVTREQRSLAEAWRTRCEMSVLTSTQAVLAGGVAEEVGLIHGSSSGGRGVRVLILRVGSESGSSEARIGFQGVSVALFGRARAAFEEGGQVWRRISSRVMTVDLRFADITMRLVAVYAPTAAFEEEQAATLALAAEQLRLCRVAGIEPVVAGDFNARLDTRCLGADVVGSYARQDVLSAGMVARAADRLSAFIADSDTAGAPLFSLVGQFPPAEGSRRAAADVGGTWRHARGGWSAIDHVFTSDRLRGRTSAAALALRSRVSVGTLDHVAIIVRFTLHASRRQVQRARFIGPPTPPPFSPDTEGQWLRYGRRADELMSAARPQGGGGGAPTCALLAEVAIRSSTECVPAPRRSRAVTPVVVPAELLAVHEAEVQAVGSRRSRRAATRRRARGAAFVAACRRSQDHRRRVGVRRVMCGASEADRGAHLVSLFGVDPGHIAALDPGVFDDVIDSTAVSEATARMSGPPSIAELRAATATLRPVAPGVDGMVADHFRRAVQGGSFEAAVFGLVVSVFAGTLDLTASSESSLTTARVVWLYKRGDRTAAASYRTLMVQCMVRKLVQRIWLTRFQPVYRLVVDSSQFGFQGGIGSVDAAAFLAWTLQSGVDAGVDVAAVSLDLIKAYDCVPIALVWRVLAGIGVPAAMVAVLERMSAVGSFRERGPGGRYGAARRYLQGLPQGDLLSPVLFNLALELARRLWVRAIPQGDDAGRLQMTSVLPIVPAARTQAQRIAAAAGGGVTAAVTATGVGSAFRRGMVGMAGRVRWRQAGGVGGGETMDDAGRAAAPVSFGVLVAGVPTDAIFFADDSSVLSTRAPLSASMAEGFMDTLGVVTNGHLCASVGRGDGSKLKAMGGGAAGGRDEVRARAVAAGSSLADDGRDPRSSSKGWEWCDGGDPVLVRGLPVEEVGQIKFVGVPIQSDGDLVSCYASRIRLADARMREYRRFFRLGSAMSPRDRLDLFFRCVVPTLLHSCELWVLTVSQQRALDEWFFSRLQQVLRIDFSTRRDSGDHGPPVSFAAAMNLAEFTLGRALEPASSMWRRRRLGFFGRIIRSLAASQAAGVQPAWHVMAAFQWRVHAAGDVVVLPTDAEVSDFLLSGRPGSWRQAVACDMASASPPLSLADARSVAGWAAGAATVPVAAFHARRSGAAVGPRPRRRRRRGVVLPAARLWESAAAQRRRSVAVATAAAVAAGGDGADIGPRCGRCGVFGHVSNSAECPYGPCCAHCLKAGALPDVVGGHTTRQCTTSSGRPCSTCRTAHRADGSSGHQAGECPDAPAGSVTVVGAAAAVEGRRSVRLRQVRREYDDVYDEFEEDSDEDMHGSLSRSVSRRR